MKKTFILCLLALFLLSIISSPALADESSEILKKMIDALGGRKLLESIKDTTLSGSLEIIQRGMTGGSTIYFKEPNMMRQDAEIMGIVITMAFDGETAWWTNPQTGMSEEMPADQSGYFKRGAEGNEYLLNPGKFGITFAYKGKETSGGKDYFVVEQSYPDGHKNLLYIDSGTYLIHKSKSRTPGPTGTEVDTEVIMSDYKKVDGVMAAHAMTILQDGQEFMKMTFTSVKFNSGLEDSFFKMK